MSQNTKKARDIPQDAIQVLIEREDWTPLLPLRRSSLAPPGSDSTSGARRQRTATTLHASIDVPDTLIASLSSTTMVTIQPQLLPLPAGRPLVLLVQIDDYIPQELSTTPSTVCFPAMAAPSSFSIHRALTPLKRSITQLDKAKVRNEVAILAYSENVHLPTEISTAAFNEGAHGLLTPPFTPDTVEAAIHSALAKAKVPRIPVKTPAIFPPTPESADTPLPPSTISPTDQESSRGPGIPFEGSNLPHERRSSIDVGGLSLSLRATDSTNIKSGRGWAGWSSAMPNVEYAEIILDMHLQASAAIDIPDLPPVPHVSNQTRNRLLNGLSTWHFEPFKLLPDEILTSVILIFESLLTLPDLPQSIRSISLQDQLAPFLAHVRALYRTANRYHSFIHALDVLQAIYMFLEHSGRAPPITRLMDDLDDEDAPSEWRKRTDCCGALNLLNDGELFLLCITAIGHDVGHPGNSNAFLKNAQTPLSKLFDDKSALERMHLTLLLRLLKRHNLGHLVDSQTAEGREGRLLVVGTVLATDMSWHFEWVERFGRAMKERQKLAASASACPADYAAPAHAPSPTLAPVSSGDGGWVLAEQEDEQVDVDSATREEIDREDRLFVCQALMKCADISNPCRPHSISKHWSTVLLEEWAAQALLERHLGLPVSVVGDANEKVQCVGQVSFIKLFTQPLLDLVSQALPGLSAFAKQCTDNRILWEKRLEKLEALSSATNSGQQMIRPVPLALPLLPPMPRYAKTVIPLSLPAFHKVPRATSILATMSPWHSISAGMKSTSVAGTSGTSAGTHGTGSGNGNSRIWAHSRPESAASVSTLGSGSGGISLSIPQLSPNYSMAVHSNGNGSGNGNGNGPTTPVTSASTSGYGRSPVSPLTSPPWFSSNSPNNGSSTATANAPFPLGSPGASLSSSLSSGTVASFGPSIWDVDADKSARSKEAVRHGWNIRNGKKSLSDLPLGPTSFGGVILPPSMLYARRASIDIVVSG